MGGSNTREDPASVNYKPFKSRDRCFINPNRILDIHQDDDVRFRYGKKDKYNIEAKKSSMSGGEEGDGREVRGPRRKGKELHWNILGVLT